jgi:hypothetical protein
MNQATGWASDVITAFQHGTLTAAELWDILLHHVDDAQADQCVSRLLGRFNALLRRTAFEHSAEGSGAKAGSRERKGVPRRQRTMEEEFLVIEDLT